jgi:hypothetical protein
MELMNPIQRRLLANFKESIATVPWFAHAGESYENGIVVADAAVGWDDWNNEMLAVWGPRSVALEDLAESSIGDVAIHQIFRDVSTSIDERLRAGAQAYFDWRPATSPNAKINADLGLWPELLDCVKRDVSWAAVEAVLQQPDFFTDLLKYYREGRWPCAWDGEFPHGRIVLL